jgi:Zinc finger, C2H2 type
MMICGKCSDELVKIKNQIKNVENLYMKTVREEFRVASLSAESSVDGEASSIRSDCTESSSSSGTSTAVEKGADNPKKEKHQCGICNKEFPAKENLHKHIEFRHVKKKNFCCDRCGKWYFNKHQVRTHMINNHTVRNLKTLDKSRPFKCSKCPKRFKSCGDLKYHQEVHSGKL